MSRKRPSEYDPSARFQSVNAECRLTGFSRGYIINGCRNDLIPHIMVGRDYRIDHHAWMDQLSREAAAGSW